MIRARIVGTGSTTPKRILTNKDLESIVDTSDEWITRRTGIKERRISSNGQGENTSELATAASLKECSAEFEMVWKPGDAGFEALKDAWLNGTEIALAFLSDAYDNDNAEGPVGDWSITNFSRSEPLEEAIIVNVTAKLSKFDSWFDSGSGA